MELWIRSQDKRTLVNTRRIDVDDNNIIIWDEGKYASDVFMGEYATKERALEVLDEIQELLEKPQQHIEGTYTYYMPNDGSSKIYEIPKE